MGWTFHVGALAFAPLSLAQAVISGGFVVLVVLTERLLGAVTRRETPRVALLRPVELRHVCHQPRAQPRQGPGRHPFEVLAPLGCGVRPARAGAAVRVLRGRPGSSIAIFGTGGVGLPAVMAAHAVGCTTIAVVGRNPARVALARDVGATHVVDARSDDVAGALRALSGGRRGERRVHHTARGAVAPGPPSGRAHDRDVHFDQIDEAALRAQDGLARKAVLQVR